MTPFTATNLASASIAHGFFGRMGGASTGLYASLNAGPGSSDDPKAVEENRKRIAGHFGAGPERLLSAYQVHSPTAVHVTGPWQGERPEADAMVTATPNLALCILAADCAPLLFADTQARIIGAAHAGWKGALGGVIEATIDAMVRLGAKRERILAAIGPCIAQDSYEVGPEYEAQFVAAEANNARYFRKGAGDRRHFNLKNYCAARTARAGLENVEVLPHDTCMLERDFFSNRRAVKRGEGDFGRNASVIMLR